MVADSLTLSQLNATVSAVVASSPALRNRWVAAELSDVNMRGHCYMELIEKDNAGRTVARMRATIWQSQLYRILAKFRAATGRELQGGLKVMLLGTVNFHPQYGISFNVSDIDPAYTLGDLERLRREILMQLQREGVLENNKMLQMPAAPQRIAVISAEGAAGYGDFMNQLVNNPYKIVFYPVLFRAVMQGERTAESVMAALERIEMSLDVWDCVVIIRGGGSTTDLNGFDNLELARRVATFPLPVIVGIGHERDRTVLDEIANTRVKTPTAAAEYLVGAATAVWQRLETLMQSIAVTANAMVSGCREQLSQLETRIQAAARMGMAEADRRLASISALLPALAHGSVERARQRLLGIASMLPQSAGNRLGMERQRLDFLRQQIQVSAERHMERERNLLDRLQQLVGALSPESTLHRGYTLTTTATGKIVTDSSQLAAGDVMVSRFAHGSARSTVTDTER